MPRAMLALKPFGNMFSGLKTGARFGCRMAPLRTTRLASSLPTIAQVSFWKNLVPKPLRQAESRAGKASKSAEWNPATYFIVMSLLIGSMSIHMIVLRKNFENFSRQADVRIGLLREVVEKLQNGEEVDVEKVLGTGDPEKELQWEQVLEEYLKSGRAAKPRQKSTKAATELATTPTEITELQPEAARTSGQTRASGLDTFF